MTRKALTPALIALMASGGVTLTAGDPAAGTPEAIAAAAAATEAQHTAEAAAAAAAGTPEAVAAAAAAAAGKEGIGGAAPAATTPSAVTADVTTFLQGQIASKDALLLNANVELNGLKAKVADFEASLGGLKEIAAASINNMRVALNGPKLDLSALSPTELLAQHAAATKDFNTKFVAGGVAAVDAVDASKDGLNGGDAVDPVQLARLDSFLR